MHFAEELTGRYRNDRRAIPAICISDVSHISCVANDYGFEFVFSRYIDALGNKGDVLFTLSTSGNSPNILRAVLSAKEKGMKIIALTGKTEANSGRWPISKYGFPISDLPIVFRRYTSNYPCIDSAD